MSSIFFNLPSPFVLLPSSDDGQVCRYGSPWRCRRPARKIYSGSPNLVLKSVCALSSPVDSAQISEPSLFSLGCLGLVVRDGRRIRIAFGIFLRLELWIMMHSLCHLMLLACPQRLVLFLVLGHSYVCSILPHFVDYICTYSLQRTTASRGGFVIPLPEPNYTRNTT